MQTIKKVQRASSFPLRSHRIQLLSATGADHSFSSSVAIPVFVLTVQYLHTLFFVAEFNDGIIL
uniref:Uncharacterized protein n=1 Tax=Anguilla anguilla TaxID=7936 RepID=A0A0E9PZM9_ANGAN